MDHFVLFKTFILVLLYSVSTANAADCPSNWVKHGNMCYKFVVVNLSVRGKTWEDAENICKAYGGHLTSISSSTEQSFIFNNIKQYKNDHFWIGLNDRANESVFVWTDGNNSTYRNWNYGEPNDFQNEDCVEIPGSSGKMNDNSCKKEFSYICSTMAGKPIPTQPTMQPPTTLTPLYCDAGWQHYGSSCYKFSTVARSWVDASKDCHQSGGYLVKIDNADEQHYLTYVLKNIKIGNMWIGLSDRSVEGLYIWEGDNSVANYTNWNSGEPNDHAGNEDCIDIYTKFLAGYWNDDYCDAQKGYICEKPNGQNLCPVNWVPFNDSCYQFNVHPLQSVTWQAARNSCLAVPGSDLLSIHSSSEQLFLAKQLNDLKSGNVWIGLNDIDKEGVFVWTDRTPLNYKNWGKYSPGVGWVAAISDCSQMTSYSQNATWGTTRCTNTNRYICKMSRAPKSCDAPFGLANYLVGDSQITASSSKDSNSQPSQARLNLKPVGNFKGSWCAANNKKGEYLQVDLGLVRRIGHIALQGRPSSTDFVKSFFVKYGSDGKAFVTLGADKNQPYKVFKASTNTDDVQNIMLGEIVSGRYIRIYPLEWSNNICMRAEIYGCEGHASSVKCGDGWEEGPDSLCYQFITNRRKMWADARASCTSQGGDLLSIVTNKERIYIDNRMKALASSVTSFWIGLNDRESSKLYQWSDQSPYLVTRWDGGYPSDTNNSKSCVELLPGRLAWRDASCGYYKPYICKLALQGSAGAPKYSRTANWISTTDFYWPLDGITDNKVLGTNPAPVTGSVIKATMLQNNKNVLQFAGYNSYINAGNFGDQCIADAEACTYGISISLIIKIDSDAASWSSKTFLVDTINDDTLSTSRGFALYLLNGQLNVAVLTVKRKWTLTKTLRAGIWQHVVVTWTTSGLRLYLNGVASGSSMFGSFQTPPHNTNNAGITIGSRATQQVNGNFYMRALAIWYRELTANEIKDIYNSEFGNCKFGWKEFGQYCYQFNYEKKTWQDARLQCQKNGGELVSINSPVEQAHVSLEAGDYGTADYAWIGFHDKSIESAWEWSDGTTPRFSNWYNLQPDNWANVEDCAHTYAQYWALGRWNDISCNSAMSYICKSKKAYVPTGGVTPTTAMKSKQICGFTTSFISCPTHTVLSVTSANYGRTSSVPCGGPISITNCRLDVASKVKSMCDGKSYCTLRPTDALFGKDPCPSVPKYLEVSYTCKQGTDSTPGCPTGWQRSLDGNVCYGLMMDKKNWADARTSCKKNGGELVSIHSGTESTLVTSLLVKSWDVGDIWIGLTDQGNRGVYRWSDKTPVDFTHWFNGEPNDRNTQGGCVRATLTSGSRDWMYWVDTDCNSNSLSYVCKKYRDNYVPPTRAPIPTPTGPCPSGWKTYKLGCYKVFMQPKTWTAARDLCRSFSKTDLVSIHDTAEDSFVSSLTNSSYDAWIGLNDRGPISGHVWSDYSPVQFTNWGVAQPDSHSGQQACVTIKSIGGWYDVGCFSTRPYICKMRRPLKATTSPPPTTKPVPTTQIPGICDPGWTYWNNLCYHFSNESSTNLRSWFDARSLCQKERGDLVSLRNAAENQFVFNQIKNRYRSWGIWMGLNDLGSEGAYKWSDGSPLSYTNYAPNEPNDWMGLEDCLEMRRYDGKWNDQSCGRKQPFVCRKHNNTVIPPFTMIPPTPGPALGKCKPGWINYDKSCYKFVFTQLQNWANAQSVCKASTNGSMAGNLITINSMYEQAFVTTMIKNYKGILWIGLNDLHTEGTYMWADNSPVNYVNWEKGKPSYNYYADCVAMTTGNQVSIGRWDVQSCTNFHGYICESVALPIGSNPVTPTASPDCPSNFIKFRDDCYMTSYNATTWDLASQKCKTYNADLISIHNTIEQAFLVKNMVHFTGNMWTGLSRQNMAMGFTWSDQSIQEYTHWSRGEPERPKKQRTCVQVKSSDGRWTEVDCGLKNAFICKINKGEPHVTPSFQGQCLPGWRKFEKHCYLFQPNNYLAWAQARLSCTRQGGDLVSILSREERDFLIYQLKDFSVTSVWTGLNDRNTEGGYEWSDGSPSSYIDWATNEPNDPGGVENCMEMYSRTGELNDLYCSKTRPYVCKSNLECSTPLGMSGGSIKDNQITISSSIDDQHGASNSRLNSSNAWCANTSISDNYIQVDLLNQTRISKISIQGTSSGVAKPSYIRSFSIGYGSYDNQLMSYLRSDGLLSVITANKDASSVVTVTLDPPIDTRFIRIVPQSWVNGICAKLEFYGCSFECQGAMGMESRRIKDGQIKASSNKDGYDASQARPKTNGWCPLESAKDKSPWLQVRFAATMKRITQITTWGASKGYVAKYKLAYSDDGMKWINYTEKGIVRIFRGNMDSTSPMTHLLGEPIITQNFRIIPLAGQNMCLRLEIFGCANGCLDPLGIEKGPIEDAWMSASTYLDSDHKPSMGRLNNPQGWCAAANDKKQFLTIDLSRDMRVRQIATQGCTEGWITKYGIRFKRDDIPWKNIVDKGVVVTFTGNNDGKTVVSNVFPKIVRGRYFMVTPLQWSKRICLRVELYGCEPYIRPTDAPTGIPATTAPPELVYKVSMRFPQQEWVDDYNNKDSATYKSLASRVTSAVNNVYATSTTFSEAIVTGFRRGSVIVDMKVIFIKSTQSVDYIEPLKAAVKSGRLGDLEVDPNSFNSTVFDGGKAKPQSGGRSSGLSSGGKAAIAVVFVLIAVAVACAVGWYFFRKRRSQFIFKQQTFDNPIHFSSKAYDMES